MARSEYLVGSSPDDTVIEIKNADIIKADVSDNLYDVIINLITNGISKLFIFDKNLPVGIVTDKDIIRFLYNERSGKRFDEITVDQIMNSICYAIDSLTCKQAAQTMLINKISSLGIGSRQHLSGIVTKTDLLQYYVNRMHDTSKVLDYMTVSYYSADVESKLHEIIKKMITCDVSRVVITENQTPVGIITNGDIFRITMSINKLSIVQSSLTTRSEENRLWSESGFVGSKQAGEIMSEGIININSNQNMMEAAKLMLEKKIDSLGVSNSSGELVGIINKTNVLYALANAK
ncbi:CBS domain-containing protein [Candidatus Nitrosotenuis uzonensis]|uniref:Putative signal transduction protein with CBS domains n=1 Tax=Candidatus Nitrosotenuis uzonensis TaxID=1407055 RepID=A0A812F8D4_9ARCH|nr:CBS domain-containing protein [Candidatus Nitrosotenuis uzonensis]MCA2003210.1 CBS domain-containing protein [Candidatus Nitrosotenuis sp.]CAE6498740.1 putative signal transduction protein with CBS domains [Candidatus Nitrosotenuis uzonensis]